MTKLELVQAFKMEAENEHLRAYRKVFPQAQLTIFQMELITEQVADAKAWKEALTFWAGNDYRPQSVFKMIEYYKGLAGGNKAAWQSVGANNQPEPADSGPCKVCGKETCLTFHKDAA